MTRSRGLGRVWIAIVGMVLPAPTALSLGGSATKLVPIVLDLTATSPAEHFTTELTLANRGTTPTAVHLTYTPSTFLGASGGGTADLSLFPGQQIVVPDAISFLRSMGLPIPTLSASQGGSLLVSFTGLSSPDAAFVGARTTTLSGSGRAGLAYSGIDLAAAPTGPSYLYGLRRSPTDRPNLALVNAGSSPITLRVTLYSGAAGDGRSFALSPDTMLDPGQWTQINRVLDKAGFTNGYAKVEIVSGSGPYVAYAVFNDFTTNDGSYVTAEPALMPAEMRVLPVLVESSSFQSELVLTNPLSVSQTATLAYVESLSPAGGAGGSVTLNFRWPDKEQRGVCTPTASQTITKNDVEGTDLGYSFETPNGLMFLFGDTIGTKILYHAGDTTALSTTTDPESPLVLNFLTNSGGSTYLIQPPGVAMGADDVPNSGITLNGQIYIVCSTGSDTSLPNPHVHDQSVLVRFDPATKGITTLRTISSIPGGHFINLSLHASGSDALIFGLGDYRATDVYLSTVPATSFESGGGTRYFAGLVDGQPTWTDQGSGAVPILVDNPLHHTPPDAPTIGNVSVVYSKDLGLWLMTYDGGRQTEATNGVYFSYASNPWGPWSQPQLIFNAKRDHDLGVFIHDPSIVPDDLLHGPTINPTNNPPATTRGGTYAPFLIERFVTVRGQTLRIYYTLSTWNPYTVVRMRSEFAIAYAP